MTYLLREGVLIGAKASKEAVFHPGLRVREPTRYHN